jgi:hypothetical protein
MQVSHHLHHALTQLLVRNVPPARDSTCESCTIKGTMMIRYHFINNMCVCVCVCGGFAQVWMASCVGTQLSL